MGDTTILSPCFKGSQIVEKRKKKKMGEGRVIEERKERAKNLREKF